MATNTLPAFPKTPRFGIANISSAVTGLTVSGVTGLTKVDFGTTSPAEGRKVKQVSVKATGTTTAGMVRLWVYSGSGNAQLVKEVAVTANTASASNPAFSSDWYPDNLDLPASYELYASTHNAEAFNVYSFAGDYV